MGFGDSGFTPISSFYQRWLHPYYNGGYFNLGPVNWSVIAIGRVYLSPIRVPRSLTVDQIVFPDTQGIVTTGHFRGGIYTDNGDTPAGGKLLADTGTSPPTAVLLDRAIVLPLTSAISLSTGITWVGVQADILNFPVYGMFTSDSPTVPNPFNGCYFDNPGGFGAFPNVCPQITNDNGHLAFWSLRVASIK